MTHGEGGREQLVGGILGSEIRREHVGSGSLSTRPEVTWYARTIERSRGVIFVCGPIISISHWRRKSQLSSLTLQEQTDNQATQGGKEDK